MVVQTQMAETRDEYLWESDEMGSEVLLRETMENLKGADIVAEAIISQRETETETEKGGSSRG